MGVVWVGWISSEKSLTTGEERDKELDNGGFGWDFVVVSGEGEGWFRILHWSEMEGQRVMGVWLFELLVRFEKMDLAGDGCLVVVWWCLVGEEVWRFTGYLIFGG